MMKTAKLILAIVFIASAAWLFGAFTWWSWMIWAHNPYVPGKLGRYAWIITAVVPVFVALSTLGVMLWRSARKKELKKFSLWTVRNLCLVAYGEGSALAEIIDQAPVLAGFLLEDAYTGMAASKVFDRAIARQGNAEKNTAGESFGGLLAPPAIKDVDLHQAVAEACEIYSTRPRPKPRSKFPPLKPVSIAMPIPKPHAWDYAENYKGNEKAPCPYCKRHRVSRCRNGHLLCDKCDYSPDLTHFVSKDEQDRELMP
jgi:hypothetical protein